MTRKDTPDTEGQFNIGTEGQFSISTENPFFCVGHFIFALADEPKATEQPPMEITVNGHLYRLSEISAGVPAQTQEAP